MSNEAKGPYTTGYMRGLRTVIDGSGVVVYSDDTSAGVNMFADAANYAHSQALTSQAARLKELEEDREWLRSQWERHRKALNAIAWGEYDNVAFCRRLAQDELAIGVKVANDRAAATVAALTSQAARVRELEEALTHIVEYWNRSENDRAMSDALYHMIETAEATLTPKEAQ